MHAGNMYRIWFVGNFWGKGGGVSQTFLDNLNIRLKQIMETFEIISDEHNWFRTGRRGGDKSLKNIIGKTKLDLPLF